MQLEASNDKGHHAGDSRHTQNIQINKVIGENEKCLLFFGKTKHTFWPNQYNH